MLGAVSGLTDACISIQSQYSQLLLTALRMVRVESRPECRSLLSLAPYGPHDPGHAYFVADVLVLTRTRIGRLSRCGWLSSAETALLGMPIRKAVSRLWLAGFERSAKGCRGSSGTALVLALSPHGTDTAV